MLSYASIGQDANVILLSWVIESIDWDWNFGFWKSQEFFFDRQK